MTEDPPTDHPSASRAIRRMVEGEIGGEAANIRCRTKARLRAALGTDQKGVASEGEKGSFGASLRAWEGSAAFPPPQTRRVSCMSGQSVALPGGMVGRERVNPSKREREVGDLPGERRSLSGTCGARGVWGRGYEERITPDEHDPSPTCPLATHARTRGIGAGRPAERRRRSLRSLAGRLAFGAIQESSIFSWFPYELLRIWGNSPEGISQDLKTTISKNVMKSGLLNS